MSEDTKGNTGDWNTGDWNTGDRNTGDRNTGNRNTGYRNTGNRNTGNRNTGNRNTGDRNTGNRNTGDRNTGDRNTGDWNTGDRNTGDWNTCDKESGFFNTEASSNVRVFNTHVSVAEWESAPKPNFIYFNTIRWIPDSEMTDEEKKANPLFHVAEGYLKEYAYKDAFKMSWDNATEEDRKLVESLPGFDAAVFLEISGIDVKACCTPNEIVVDGVTYVKK